MELAVPIFSNGFGPKSLGKSILASQDYENNIWEHILRKVGGGSENGNFPLLYVIEMSLRSKKSPKHPFVII